MLVIDGKHGAQHLGVSTSHCAMSRHPEPSPPQGANTQNQRKKKLLLTAVVLLVPIVPFAMLGELPGESWLHAGAGPLRYGALGAALLAADVFLPVPSTIVGSMLGSELGFVAGFLWGWLGLLLGNVAGYWAGRLALRGVGADLSALQTNLLLFATRPVPILAEAVAIAAGAGGVPFRGFLLWSTLGNAVFAAALAANGAAFLSDSWTGIGLALPMALPVVGWLVLRRVKRAEIPLTKA